MNSSFNSNSQLINSGNIDPMRFTSTLDATYRAPSVAFGSGSGSSKMTGGYKYKKRKSKLSKRYSKQSKVNSSFMVPSFNPIVGGRKRSVKRMRKPRRSMSRSRHIGMSLARGVSASRHFFGGNSNGSGNIPTFPTGYALGGEYNTLGGALANPPVYTPTYNHIISKNL
jgi:hypothetical protein